MEGEIVIEGIAFDITDQKQAEQALRDSEEKYRLLVENQTDMVVKVDLEGRFLFVSRAYCETFGKTEQELLGNAFMPLVHQDDRKATTHAMQALHRPPHRCYVEQRALTKNGWRWLAWADRAVLDERGELVAIVGVGRDISERKAAEEALLHERERALITLHSIGDAVITTDAGGRVEYLNPSAESLTGWKNGEAADRPLAEVFRIVNEDTGEPAVDPVARCVREGCVVGLDTQSALIDRMGEERAIEHSAAPIRNARGHVDGAVLVFKDITTRRRLDQQIAFAASHDSLTGLVNRAKFEERLDQALAAFLTRGTPAVLCYLDLDQFKVVNDAAGHDAGDEMLKQVAALLSASVRSRDTLARLGGDEFGLLLENCSVGGGIKICEALIGILSDFRFEWGDRRFGIGVSIGLVSFTLEGAERSLLTSRADMACYAAKDAGRNRVYVYHPEDFELKRRHREIIRAAELREALEKDRFVLYAQPITWARTPYGQPWRHEVLIRMRGQEDGQLLLPGAFIPAAERYGLIGELDRWVIKTALREYAGLGNGSSGAGIAINISGTSLSDEGLPKFVRSELAASGVSPSQVCFEITETAAVSRLSLARRFIEDLCEHGCSFALDDFGSGLSSFNYLKHLPVDWLKVDGSFVKGMSHDPVDQAMVKAINQIGHVMGLRTVAERVDSAAVLTAALASGVDFLQGFEIGRPVPLREIGI
jgi:diguanylate cyclase (GGDEF)-like protein/PAS domain S-box-containing protein